MKFIQFLCSWHIELRTPYASYWPKALKYGIFQYLNSSWNEANQTRVLNIILKKVLPLLVQQDSTFFWIFELTEGANDLDLVMQPLLVVFQVVRICCFVIAQVTGKTHPLVHLAHVKSHHFLCPRCLVAFFTLVLSHIVFAFHVPLQHIVLCALILTLRALYQIPCVPLNVISQAGKPFRWIVTLVTQILIGPADMFVLHMTLQGSSVLENFSTTRFGAREILVQMLFVVVSLQNFLAFTFEITLRAG